MSTLFDLHALRAPEDQTLLVYDQNFQGAVRPLYPLPISRCLWKDSLITPYPPPPHFKPLSLLPPHTPHSTPATHRPPPLQPIKILIVHLSKK